MLQVPSRSSVAALDFLTDRTIPLPPSVQLLVPDTLLLLAGLVTNLTEHSEDNRVALAALAISGCVRLPIFLFECSTLIVWQHDQAATTRAINILRWVEKAGPRF